SRLQDAADRADQPLLPVRGRGEGESERDDVLRLFRTVDRGRAAGPAGDALPEDHAGVEFRQVKIQELARGHEPRPPGVSRGVESEGSELRRNTMTRRALMLCFALPALVCAQTPRNRAPLPNEQWVKLFNGKDLTNWAPVG